MRKIFLLCLFMFVNVVYATDVELAWYDGDTTINGPTSCTVGGTFLPPTPPARTGYVFNGWKKIVRKCGIDQLNTSIGGSSRGYTKLNGSAGTNESDYGLTTGSGQWAVEFSYGTVWGMANCNDTKGKTNTVGTPTLASSGKYCWCQVTGFTASGNDYTSGPQCTTTASSSWLYHSEWTYTSTCASSCAVNCSSVVMESSQTANRGRLFGAVGQ